MGAGKFNVVGQLGNGLVEILLCDEETKIISGLMGHLAQSRLNLTFTYNLNNAFKKHELTFLKTRFGMTFAIFSLFRIRCKQPCM